MRNSRVYWSLGGLAALLAGYAICNAFPYEPAKNPTPPTRAVPVSPECDLAFPVLATKPVARTTEVKAPACGVPSTTPVTGPCTSPACCAVTFTAASKEPNVYDLLAKLEALKAKQDALDAEVRETSALLNEKFRTLQMRMAKVGAGVPTPVTSYQPPPPSAAPVSRDALSPATEPMTPKTEGLTKPTTTAADDGDLPQKNSTGSKPLAPPRP